MFSRKIVLKISGEALNFKKGRDIDIDLVKQLADDLGYLSRSGVKILVVIGGGNFSRGYELANFGLNKIVADSVGMMSTVINSLVLQDILKQSGVSSFLYSSFQISHLCQLYNVEVANRNVEDGHIVIVGGGTGVPCFTTDMAAALRAVEIKADALIKLTKVDGVYDKDPVQSDAVFYSTISYDEILKKGIPIMDFASVILCKENSIPIYVANMKRIRELCQIIDEKKIGTIICRDV